MKVVCISNKNNYCNLTIGKIYNVIEFDNDSTYYRISNDENISCWYYHDKFISLKKSRNLKIKKIHESR